MNNSNRILIIHTDGNTFNNPSLKCIIDLLLENGFKIDLRYPETQAPMPIVDNVRLMPFGKLLSRIKLVLYNKICSSSLVALLVFVENLIIYRKYDLVVGVDRQGLLEANVLNKLTGTPYILVSFEIMFKSETSIRYKSLEINASKNISMWVIQDEVRAEQLMKENECRNNKLILPLASAGLGQVNDLRLRDQLHIPKDKNVAILIGSISKWTMARDIIQSIPDWPDKWVLVVHERYGNTREILEGELSGIESYINNKIFISDKATDTVDDMSSILSGVSAGIAFYQPDYAGPYTGNNLKYLGLASGKISTYLRYGVPVIANEVGLYAEEIRKNILGVIVRAPENIPEQLKDFKSSNYSNNAKKYFSDYLDFNNYSERLLKDILSIIKDKKSA